MSAWGKAWGKAWGLAFGQDSTTPPEPEIPTMRYSGSSGYMREKPKIDTLIISNNNALILLLES